MEKPLAIANAFIQLAQQTDARPLTQMKLQKLIFFAHGWNLALRDAPLVNEAFQAWKYGPVLPSAYHEFKSFGTLGIDRLGTALTLTPEEGLEWEPPVISDTTGLTHQLLHRVWDVYGGYSGTELSQMTHLPDTPWSKTRARYGDARDIPIPDSEIKTYFHGMLPACA